jgi:UDP-N-acetylglucosamine--N-acetylmuramyl-(pentapeptide) pyrophosphoryl-undecaprenol N-acetylglucosamine transferase
MKEKKYMNLQKHKRVIISGGGTGGHIFPALAIANALKQLDPSVEILFVGADGRMEMEKVPAAGYPIEGLPVAGFRRNSILKNIPVVFRLIRSLLKARKIVKQFKPDVAVGVGGYASGPVLRMAGWQGIPTLIQEQNSYAGVTNRLLAKKARVICVAYKGMEKYFPALKILMTGNPVRSDFGNLDTLRAEALNAFGFSGSEPVILVLGGSLGAGTINATLSERVEELRDSGCQWIWQTGRNYFENVNALLSVSPAPNVRASGFIDRMDLAFAAADIIISRAGAGTISELCLVGKPVILVPSPNVAEDHQTKNAMALVNNSAAVLVSDRNAMEDLVSTALSLVKDEKRKEELSVQIKRLAEHDSDKRIAAEVLKLMKND